MFFLRILWISIFAFSGIFSSSFGENITGIYDDAFQEKIYVPFEQIIINDIGIFVIIEEIIMPIDQIHHDEYGFYFQRAEFKKCRNGHNVVCLDCSGCGNKQCKWRCQCLPGPRQN